MHFRNLFEKNLSLYYRKDRRLGTLHMKTSVVIKRPSLICDQMRFAYKDSRDYSN